METNISSLVHMCDIRDKPLFSCSLVLPILPYRHKPRKHVLKADDLIN